jgi:hypothetical protein
MCQLRDCVHCRVVRGHCVHDDDKPRLLFVPQQLRGVLGRGRVGLHVVRGEQVPFVRSVQFVHRVRDGRQCWQVHVSGMLDDCRRDVHCLRRELRNVLVGVGNVRHVLSGLQVYHGVSQYLHAVRRGDLLCGRNAGLVHALRQRHNERCRHINASRMQRMFCRLRLLALRQHRQLHGVLRRPVVCRRHGHVPRMPRRLRKHRCRLRHLRRLVRLWLLPDAHHDCDRMLLGHELHGLHLVQRDGRRLVRDVVVLHVLPCGLHERGPCSISVGLQNVRRRLHWNSPSDNCQQRHHP